MINKILDFLTPKQYSLVEENNILGFYDNNTLVTKNENFIMGIEIEGVSYTALDDNNIISLFNQRMNAINAINDSINIKFIIKRRKKYFNKEYNIDNIYAKDIINHWEGNEKIFENKYYIIIETRTQNTIGYLEKKKAELTTSINESKLNVNITYTNKLHILQNAVNRIIKSLNSYGATQISANMLLNLYAEYCNGFYMDLNISNGLLGDSYIASNIKFNKDYFTYTHNNKVVFSRFISIKAYDVEQVSSLFSNSLLYLDKELNIYFFVEKLSKQKATSKLTNKIKFSNNIAKPLLLDLKEQVISDRNSLQYFTYTIQLFENSKEALDITSNDISVILTNYGLINVIENINQIPIYFSLFPSKEHLNNRKRLQTSDVISNLLLFERDTSGLIKNSWGDYPLTMFKNQNKTPFLFNFHCEDKKQSLGHTLVIGGTGQGKTTLVSFLIANCFKYDINILALDRLNGMYAITNYLNGEYLDGNADNFKLNPFSLEYSKENQNFLISFLCSYLNLSNENPSDTEAIRGIEKVVDTTFRNLKLQNTEFNVEEIKNSLIKLKDENIRLKLESATQNPIFQSMKDSINLENKLSVVNMDFISSMPKDASLIAYYLFHKILYLAKNKSKGFLLFIDEFRSYTNNDEINERINMIITQARKLDGVIALAIQDLEQFNDVKNAQSYIDNMGQYIIFPTKNVDSFEKYGIRLSDYEKNFLEDSDSMCRKVLIKNKIKNTSNIIDIDLSKLGSKMKFLSSSANDVNIIKKLQQESPQSWRDIYIRN